MMDEAEVRTALMNWKAALIITQLPGSALDESLAQNYVDCLEMVLRG